MTDGLRETAEAEATTAPEPAFRARMKAFAVRFRLLGLILLPILAFLLSMTLGRYHVSLGEIFTLLGSKLHLTDATVPEQVNTVIWNVRLPRILVALLIGAGLSLSGAAYQGMFRNPLVSPDILGASAGAGFGAALGIMLSKSVIVTQLLALGFGLGAVVVTYLLAGRLRRGDPTLFLVLTGILVGTVFTSLISILKVLADPYDKLPAITFWLMGSLAAINTQDVLILLGPMVVGGAAILIVRWHLNPLSFGEEEARAMGAETGKLRVIIIVRLHAAHGLVGRHRRHRRLGGTDHPASGAGHRRARLRQVAARVGRARRGLPAARRRPGAPGRSAGAAARHPHRPDRSSVLHLPHGPHEEGLDMILELRDLTCGYGRRKVLSNVDLTVAAGDNLCLLGPNGVGKTTLFRTILGAIDPMGGDVLVDGKSIRHQSRRNRARSMAYVPQAHTAPFPFHVMDVVLTGRTAHIPLTSAPSRHDEDVARAALERMDISDLADRPYTELSGGERQLVLIARALAQEPRVLIMDEPSSHLDFGNQARLLALVKTLVQEGDLAVLMSSHFPNHAFACATRVGLVKDGRLVALGNPDDVLTEESLEGIYGIPVRILEGDPETDPALKVCAARTVRRESA